LVRNMISDDYIAGFVDGEGMFYVSVVPSKETRTGWQVIYFLKISQNPSGRFVLEEIKQRLDSGYIKANSLTDKTDRSLALVVRDLSSLRDKVIPFFEGKLAIKKEVFDKFKEVIRIVDRKEHLNKIGITKILDISYTMNTGKRKFVKEKILNSYLN
jgi:hypothetical protein